MTRDLTIRPCFGHYRYAQVLFSSRPWLSEPSHRAMATSSDSGPLYLLKNYCGFGLLVTSY